MASLADAGLVTVGATDLADAGVAPLVDAGMTIPANLAAVVTAGMIPLADAGMVNVGVTDMADTVPVDGDGVDIDCGDRLLTGV